MYHTTHARYQQRFNGKREAARSDRYHQTYYIGREAIENATTGACANASLLHSAFSFPARVDYSPVSALPSTSRDGLVQILWLASQRLTNRVLCSLELNVHQLVLSDLATNIGDSKDNTPSEELATSIDLITSQVETRAVDDEGTEQPRVFMVCCMIACPPANC